MANGAAGRSVSPAGPPSQGARRPNIASVATLLVVVLLAGSCSHVPGLDDGGRDTGGPLARPAEGGFVALRATHRPPYSMTVGSFALCRDDDDGEPLVLDEVHFDERVAPLDVRPVVRTIPPESEMRRPYYRYSPIGAVHGRPGHFVGRQVGGSFSDDLAGTVVDAPCSDRHEHRRAAMELLVVMKVPRGGSDITGFTIDYHVGNHDYAVKVPWRMVGCGPQVARGLCAPQRSRSASTR